MLGSLKTFSYIDGVFVKVSRCWCPLDLQHRSASGYPPIFDFVLSYEHYSTVFTSFFVAASFHDAGLNLKMMWSFIRYTSLISRSYTEPVIVWWLFSSLVCVLRVQGPRSSVYIVGHVFKIIAFPF